MLNRNGEIEFLWISFLFFNYMWFFLEWNSWWIWLDPKYFDLSNLVRLYSLIQCPNMQILGFATNHHYNQEINYLKLKINLQYNHKNQFKLKPKNCLKLIFQQKNASLNGGGYTCCMVHKKKGEIYRCRVVCAKRWRWRWT